jgi:hypothetical protein
VYVEPLLAAPLTVTTTGSVIPPVGIDATIWVSLQLVAMAVSPLKVTTTTGLVGVIDFHHNVGDVTSAIPGR